MAEKIKLESFYVPLDITAAINEHDQLVQTGETCRVEALKNQFAWMRGHVNGWYGWSGDGKSTLLDFLCVLKVKYDNWKICMYKPENMDTVIKNGKAEIKANRIYKNLAWTLNGKTWNKNFSIKHKTNAMSFEEEQEALRVISKNIYIMYPRDRSFPALMKYYKFMYEMYGIDVFVLDPWNVVKTGGEGAAFTKDEQLSDAFHQVKEFAMETNSVFNIVSHPKSMDQQRESKAKNSPFKVVNPYMILGGSAWDMKMDGQFSVYQPERHLWPRGSQVELHTYKAKDSEIAGYEWGMVQFNFDKLRRQYYFGDLYPMSGELRPESKKQTEINFNNTFTQPIKPDDPDSMPF